MKIDTNSETPIFLQISKQLEDAIFLGIYQEETQIPSTNEIATLLHINPHTVRNGMNVLVEKQIIYKKRGLGMYVCTGAIEKIKKTRNNKFSEQFIEPLLTEAQKLAISHEELIEIIKGVYNEKFNSN